MNRFIKIVFLFIFLLVGSHSYSQEYAKTTVKKTKRAVVPVKKEEETKPVQKASGAASVELGSEDEFMKLMKQANTYNEKRKYSDALVTYNKALEFNRKTGWVLRCRASAYFGQKDYERSISDYTAAIEANTEQLGEVYYSRGMSKAMMADNAGACADFKKAKELGFEVNGHDVIGQYCN